MGEHTTAQPAPVRQLPPRAASRRHPLRVVPGGEAAVALVFLAPALVALALFRLVPAAWAVKESLLHTSLATGSERFVGLDNYAFLFGQSPTFLATVTTTLAFVAIINPTQTLLALALAVLLTQRIPAASIWRTLIFLPVALPAVCSIIFWGVAFRPDGLINAAFARVGIGQQPFLTASGQATMSFVILLSWIGVGYWMVFLISGLQDIPEAFHEAAAVDGAGWWSRFYRITLPLLRRPLAFVLVSNTVANFLVFAPSQILTRGGPNNTTNLIMFDIYEQAYSTGDLNLASAEVVLLMIIMIAVVSVQFRVIASRDRD